MTAAGMGLVEFGNGRHEDAREREPDEVEDALGRGGGAPQGGGRRAAGEGARCDAEYGRELATSCRRRCATGRRVRVRCRRRRRAWRRSVGARRRTPGNPVIRGFLGCPGCRGFRRRRGGRRSGAWTRRWRRGRRWSMTLRSAKKSAVARGGHAPRKIQQGNTTDADR